MPSILQEFWTHFVGIVGYQIGIWSLAYTVPDLDNDEMGKGDGVQVSLVYTEQIETQL